MICVYLIYKHLPVAVSVKKRSQEEGQCSVTTLAGGQVIALGESAAALDGVSAGLKEADDVR